MKENRLWSVSPVQELFRYFNVEADKGLSQEEADYRLRRWGSNTLQEKKKKSFLEIFIDQFKDFMVLVLLAATFISGVLKEYSDAVTIIIIVILNACLGFIQEYKAERSFAALKKLSPPLANVLRNGFLQQIEAEKLVPGDVVYLQGGDRVAADVRIFYSDGLTVDESPLTGESLSVEKKPDTMDTEASSLGDVYNMAFSGTMVVGGSGRGVVVSTGENTEMGKIAMLLQEVEPDETPLQKRLARLGKILIIACLFLCTLVVLLGLWRGEEIYKMFMAGVSLAVAAIPEGLPAIVTISLALGVQRMARRMAIVRKLPAVETLGCATVICSDKTGTITENKMNVECVFSNGKNWEMHKDNNGTVKGIMRGNKKMKIDDDPPLYRTILTAILCNNAEFLERKKGITGKKREEIRGEPTETALVSCAAAEGMDKNELEKNFSRIKEYPFSSDRKCMSAVYEKNGETTLFAKGAPEVLLNKSSYIFENGEIKTLTQKRRKEIMGQIEIMASRALRTIAAAYKPLTGYSERLSAENVEQELIFLGVFGLMDPPRPSIFKSITKCNRAGIKVVMITGDHHSTAIAIGRQLGILRPGGEVITGSELDTMSDKELKERINNVYIFSRVNPQHKLRIVRCLKDQGEIVAMTGDGVNDAAAVKEADIGIAMGISGTEVTKESASLILSDDNFSTIVAAVEEGRHIYDNIRKFIRFLLGCNLGEILTMMLTIAAGLPLPLRPIQILWINLVTDGLPAMALGVDPPEENVMQRPPRSTQEGVFAGKLWSKIMMRGITIGLTTVFVFTLYYVGTAGYLVYAQTMALSTLIMAQLLHVFECRSEYYNVWESRLERNLLLVGAVFVSFSLMLCIIYLPFLSTVFQTVPLKLSDWLIVFCASIFPYAVNYAYRSVIKSAVRAFWAGEK